MLKKMFSVSNWNSDLASFLLRVSFGIGMFTHGYSKFQRYGEMKENFVDYLGISPEINLILVIFAEMFCAAFIIIGLFTRFASIPVFITMFVAFFVAHGNDPFGRKELAFIYMFISLVIFIQGAGKYSLDRFISKS